MHGTACSVCSFVDLLTEAPYAPLGDDACGAKSGPCQVEGIGSQLERGESAGHPQIRVLIPAKRRRELRQAVVERPGPASAQCGERYYESGIEVMAGCEPCRIGAHGRRRLQWPPTLLALPFFPLDVSSTARATTTSATTS